MPTETFQYKYRSRKSFAGSVLFVSDIGSERAPSDLTFAIQGEVIRLVMRLFFLGVPLIEILFHTEDYTAISRFCVVEISRLFWFSGRAPSKRDMEPYIFASQFTRLRRCRKRCLPTPRHSGPVHPNPTRRRFAPYCPHRKRRGRPPFPVRARHHCC